ncbi:MAG: NADH:ubiquinone reductase (Na(+)-transporting) subunit C [Rhizobiaceae bacterium]|nr:NADH:ubiquinone reductase (Na(+)-transporting) subunit C [Rhizobiaceae bacterium]
MADFNPVRLWRRFLAMPNDTSTKTFAVAFMVASVSAVAVAVTAVTLRPLQAENVAAGQAERMQEMLASVPGLADLLADADADAIETRLVDLDTGEYVTGVDAGAHDVDAAASDQQASTALQPADDVAGIGNRPDRMPVHLVIENGAPVLVIVQGYASGYQSTIRAYIALESDLETIAAISIYDQAETPGLGTRIAEPDWQERWAGKRVIDEDGTVRVSLGEAPTGDFEIDGVTGATRSSMGVVNLVNFWLGDHGYGPYLARLRVQMP